MELLLDKIFDPTPIQRQSVKECVQTHGDLFFTTFRSTIATFCMSAVSGLVPQLLARVVAELGKVCAVLTATLDTVTKDRSLRKQLVESCSF